MQAAIFAGQVDPGADLERADGGQVLGVVVEAILVRHQAQQRFDLLRQRLDAVGGRRRGFGRGAGLGVLLYAFDRRDQTAQGFVGRLAGDAGTRQHVFERFAQIVHDRRRRPSRLAFARQQVDEAVGHAERGVPGSRLRPLAQGDHRKMVRPGTTEEFAEHGRHFARLNPFAQFAGRQRARLFQALLAALRLGGAAFGQLDAAAMLFEEGTQLLFERFENRDVFVELGHQAIDGLLGLAEQLAFLRAFALVAFDGLGQRVQQAARRMGLVLEEAAVEHRGLHVGNDQSRDQRARLRLEIALVEQHVEQHADQIDGILVLVSDAHLVGRQAELVRIGEHFLLEQHRKRSFRTAHGFLHGARHLGLQQREHRNQFRWRHRTRANTGVAARRGTRKRLVLRTPAAQQAAQRVEHRAIVGLRLFRIRLRARRSLLGLCLALLLRLGLRCRRRVLRFGRLRIAEFRQDAGGDQTLVEFGQQDAERLGQFAFEVLEENDTHVLGQHDVALRGLDGLREVAGADRVDFGFQLPDADHRGETLVHRFQRRTVRTLHRVDQHFGSQLRLELGVVEQAQFDPRVLQRRQAAQQAIETFLEMRVERALDRRAAVSQRAHRIEMGRGARGTVLLRQFEQPVVDLDEGAAEHALQMRNAGTPQRFEQLRIFLVSPASLGGEGVGVHRTLGG